MARAKIMAGPNHLPIIETWPLPPFLNVAEGATASVQLNVGARYHAVHVVLGGTALTAAMCTAIRLYANNELFQTWTGAFLELLNSFDKRQASATNKVLTIPFERLGIANPFMRYATCINTGLDGRGSQCRKGLTDFRLEVDISGSTAPTLSGYAELSDVNTEQSTHIIRMDKWVENVAATGEYLHLNSKKMLGDVLRPFVTRIAFTETVANLTAFRLSRNGSDVITRTSKLNEKIQVDGGVRTPQTGYVIYDTGERGEHARVIDAVNIATYDVRTTHGATNANMIVWAESLGVLAS